DAATDIGDDRDRHGREPLRQLEVVVDVGHDAILRHFAAEVAERAVGRAARRAAREPAHAVQVVIAVAALDLRPEAVAETITDGEDADETFIEIRVALTAGAGGI